MALRSIRHLDYVVLLCEDVAAMKRFYEQDMEFPIYRDWGDWVEFRVGSVLLALRPRGRDYDGPSQPGSASLQMAFRVAPDDVEQCHAELLAKGVPILEAPRDAGNGHKTLFFRDPENNVLEIYADVSLGGLHTA